MSLNLSAIVVEPSALKPAISGGAPVAARKLPRREFAQFLEEARGLAGIAGEVAVLLTTDEAVRTLNRDFRRKDKATDVLSFPAAAPEDMPPGEEDEAGYAGDLAISVDTAARQAENFGHSLTVEVKILMLHGLLHLAGLDHETDKGEMAQREAALREHFELPLGLIQRTAAASRMPKAAAKPMSARKTAVAKAIAATPRSKKKAAVAEETPAASAAAAKRAVVKTSVPRTMPKPGSRKLQKPNAREKTAFRRAAKRTKKGVRSK